MTEPRKSSDVLVSIEQGLHKLTVLVAAQDLNNKLILNCLNKLIGNKQFNNLATPSKAEIIADAVLGEKKAISPSPPSIEISSSPALQRKQLAGVETNPLLIKAPQKKELVNFKIPVGQRVTDAAGKDLFMADVTITDLSNNVVVSKSKTSIAGKWQAQLSAGKYLIDIVRVTDPDTKQKIQSRQEVEITETMKSLQLPVSVATKK